MLRRLDFVDEGNGEVFKGDPKVTVCVETGMLGAHAVAVPRSPGVELPGGGER
ncbi:MAG: hypothetical protein ABR528_00070 [Pseudonocardiaceae bacterium]